MAHSKRKSGGDDAGFGGFLGGLGNLIEKLSELAEKDEELKGVKEFSGAKGVNGVYGFSIKTNLGKDRDGEGEGGTFKVERFGNVRKDDHTGRVKVHEVLEPMADVFEESDHVLVVVELPGIGEDDLKLELHDDLLTIEAERGVKKYRKEILLPDTFAPERMTKTCRNGVLEVRLTKLGE
jgi:HSP20 family protein